MHNLCFLPKIMALIKSPSPITITCLSIFFFSLILSTSSSPSPHQILDVYASLQQALQVFSPNTQKLHSLLNSSVNSLSITLLSRSSLPLNHSNYTSLTLSRLARDQARLSTPITSGIAQGSGEYFARVGVGRPARQYYMDVDTGSDVTWLQSEPCSLCYSQTDPLYNPAASSTYRPLSCNSPRCAALVDPTCLLGTCIYQLLYGDGSFTTGNFATETISFGPSGSVPGVAIGCGHNNVGLFSGAAGLLGLGGGALSLPSQIKAASFSYCLVNRDSSSSSTLDFNSTQLADSVTTPLVKNPFISTYRYVKLTGIIVGGRPVQFPQSQLEFSKDGRGGVIIDSGTTVTRLPTAVYNAVRDEFRRMTRNLSSAGSFSILDTCYDLSSMSRVRVPTVSFQFPGGKTLALPPENYLIPTDGMGTFCFAFAATSRGPAIIGNVQQQGMRVNYDLANKIIGSIMAAKLEAIRSGVSFARSLGNGGITILSDSQEALRACLEDDEYRGPLADYVYGTRRHIREQGLQVELFYISRSCNKGAHEIAKLAVGETRLEWDEVSLPEAIAGACKSDIRS